MIEICFTESAQGALQVAQSFGKGKYTDGCSSVFVIHKDGSQATPEEIEALQKTVKEEARRKWERAIPLGGKSSDVYGFPLGLNWGDIQDPLCITSRLNALKTLWSIWDEEIEKDLRLRFSSIPAELNKILTGCTHGETLRIWYSDCPDELCGFYWMMDRLSNLPKEHGPVWAIKLPQLIKTFNGLQQQSGWGAVEPGDFYNYTDLACELSDDQIQYYGARWLQLQEENTQLRSCINGSLSSAPSDIYDYYIHKEIHEQKSLFYEAQIIGNVLRKYLPGISDGIVHHRIQQMVESGYFISETEPAPDEPSYWRYLRKNNAGGE